MWKFQKIRRLSLIPGCLLAGLSGCQNESHEPGLEPIPLPVMAAYEGPGFTFSIPENWEAALSGRKIIVKPKGGVAEAELTLELHPYAAGETPQTAIAAQIETRTRIKGALPPSSFMVLESPAFRQFYTHDGSGQNPDRIFFLLATPGGKIMAIASLKQGRKISEYMTEFQAVVYSVRI